MMSDLQILSAKVLQPLACKCGKPLTRSDIDTFGDKVQIVCSACHSTVLEIEIEQPEESEPWD